MRIILLNAAILLWLVACRWLYKAMRNLRWLAGSSVAGCTFFLGVTLACGFFITRAVLLVPLGLGVVILILVHTWSATTKSDNHFAENDAETFLPDRTAAESGQVFPNDFLV